VEHRGNYEVKKEERMDRDKRYFTNKGDLTETALSVGYIQFIGNCYSGLKLSKEGDKFFVKGRSSNGSKVVYSYRSIAEARKNLRNLADIHGLPDWEEGVIAPKPIDDLYKD
jgi:hypothetical protein